MIRLKTELTLAAGSLTRFEAPFNDTELTIEDTLHRFAKDVLRPAGQELDKGARGDGDCLRSPYMRFL
jgi:hypothetical protein